MRADWAVDPTASTENMTQWAVADHLKTARCASDITGSAMSLWAAGNGDAWDAASLELHACLAVVWAGWLVVTGWTRRKLKLSDLDVNDDRKYDVAEIQVSTIIILHYRLCVALIGRNAHQTQCTLRPGYNQFFKGPRPPPLAVTKRTGARSDSPVGKESTSLSHLLAADVRLQEPSLPSKCHCRHDTFPFRSVPRSVLDLRRDQSPCARESSALYQHVAGPATLPVHRRTHNHRL